MTTTQNQKSHKTLIAEFVAQQKARMAEELNQKKFELQVMKNETDCIAYLSKLETTGMKVCAKAETVKGEVQDGIEKILKAIAEGKLGMAQKSLDGLDKKVKGIRQSRWDYEDAVPLYARHYEAPESQEEADKRLAEEGFLMPKSGWLVKNRIDDQISFLYTMYDEASEMLAPLDDTLKEAIATKQAEAAAKAEAKAAEKIAKAKEKAKGRCTVAPLIIPVPPEVCEALGADEHGLVSVPVGSPYQTKGFDTDGNVIVDVVLGNGKVMSVSLEPQCARQVLSGKPLLAVKVYEPNVN